MKYCHGENTVTYLFFYILQSSVLERLWIEIHRQSFSIEMLSLKSNLKLFVSIVLSKNILSGGGHIIEVYTNQYLVLITR